MSQNDNDILIEVNERKEIEEIDIKKSCILILLVFGWGMFLIATVSLVTLLILIFSNSKYDSNLEFHIVMYFSIGAYILSVLTLLPAKFLDLR